MTCLDNLIERNEDEPHDKLKWTKALYQVLEKTRQYEESLRVAYDILALEPANTEVRIRILKKALDDDKPGQKKDSDDDESGLDLGKTLTDFMRL